MLGAKAKADACRENESRGRNGFLRATGTPRPWTNNVLPGQVSWLAGRRCCPAFPKPRAACSGFVGQRLAAYSCGGSAGIAPASLLASDQRMTRRTSTARIINEKSARNATAFPIPAPTMGGPAIPSRRHDDDPAPHRPDRCSSSALPMRHLAHRRSARVFAP